MAVGKLLSGRESRGGFLRKVAFVWSLKPE